MTPLRPTEARGRPPHLLRAIGLDLPLIRRAMRWIALSASVVIVAWIAATLYWQQKWWTFERVLANESRHLPAEDPWYLWATDRTQPDGRFSMRVFRVLGCDPMPGRWFTAGKQQYVWNGVGLPGLDGSPTSGRWRGDVVDAREVGGDMWRRIVREGRARDFSTLGCSPAFVGRWEGWVPFGREGPFDLRADGRAFDVHGDYAFRWAGKDEVLLIYREGTGYASSLVWRYAAIGEEPVEGAGTGWFSTLGHCVYHLRPLELDR